MCGLIGYIGKRSAVPLLLEGLKRLEYRGYDSAGGVVIEKKGKLICLKTKGEVGLLVKKFVDHLVEANIGLFHTRWATHGEPSEKNAHPHCDCSKKIWLVHNGIIENYQTLKSKLIKAGHHFKSETDSEVVAHLIESYLPQTKNSFEEAVRRALLEIRGAYGLAIFNIDEPEKIIVAKNSSPLLVGLGANEHWVASDAAALIAYTKQIVYLNDGEIGVLTPGGLEIKTLSGGQTPVHKAVELDWDIEQVKKSGFAHFMLKEIFEQPESISNSFRGRLIVKEGLAKLGGLEEVEKNLRNIDKLTIISCGTSYHAGLVGKYMLEEFAGLPTDVELASEFRYRKSLINKNSAFLAISQSGETADTLAALKEIKRRGALTLGLVNTVGSTIARETDAGIYNHVGPEISVASTKAFTSQLTILTLLALYLGRQRAMSAAIAQQFILDLQKIPSSVNKILKQNSAIKRIARKYYKLDKIIFLGRKYNFPIAQEASLKLKEISYIPSQAYSSGELKHGPIALVDDKTLCVFIAPSDSVYEKNINNLEELKSRGAKLLVIASEGDKKIKKLADEVIYIPKIFEPLTPILSIIPLQLFAYYVAVFRGCPVDKPRNLAKSVTVE